MDIIYEKWDEILETVKKEHELSDVSFKTWNIKITPFQIRGDWMDLTNKG